MEEQGLIQSFEYTHELAWNTLKNLLEHRGQKDIYGSKDATREAFKLDLVEDGEIWMNMIESRNQTTHTYNEDTAKEIVTAISKDYHQQFLKLQKKLTEIKSKEQT